MILNDTQIFDLAKVGMIDPFAEKQVREHTMRMGMQYPDRKRKVISYGLSSFGYDCRINNTFRLFKPTIHGSVVDPKHIDEEALEHCIGDEVLIPPHSYILGSSLEYFKIPPDIMCLVVGKSTYARCGIIVNVTPLEPGWEGNITIEISNSSPLAARIYAGEGIAQILFFRGDKPDISYKDKKGKYQGQKGVQIAKA